ncbi:MAG TPA: hypothetical protein VEQ10_15250 [Vicinamibacteria bacterium]|nr:hypothetical protein [Vicinamibacteria bacterium]
MLKKLPPWEQTTLKALPPEVQQAYLERKELEQRVEGRLKQLSPDEQAMLRPALDHLDPAAQAVFLQQYLDDKKMDQARTWGTYDTFESHFKETHVQDAIKNLDGRLANKDWSDKYVKEHTQLKMGGESFWDPSPAHIVTPDAPHLSDQERVELAAALQQAGNFDHGTTTVGHWRVELSVMDAVDKGDVKGSVGTHLAGSAGVSGSSASESTSGWNAKVHGEAGDSKTGPAGGAEVGYSSSETQKQDHGAHAEHGATTDISESARRQEVTMVVTLTNVDDPSVSTSVPIDQRVTIIHRGP